MRPGQKVLCVKGGYTVRPDDPFKLEQLNVPMEGQTYTVRSVVLRAGKTGVYLVEVMNSQFYYKEAGLHEPAFCPDRFTVVSR